MAGWLNREKIGTITRADGETYTVHLLKVSDLRGINLQAPDMFFDLAAKSMNISRAEFDDWDFTDAMKVVELLAQGITKL